MEKRPIQELKIAEASWTLLPIGPHVCFILSFIHLNVMEALRILSIHLFWEFTDFFMTIGGGLLGLSCIIGSQVEQGFIVTPTIGEPHQMPPKTLYTNN